MNLAQQNTPPVEDIKISFPFPALDTIQGDPNYESTKKLEIQTTRHASTVEIILPPLHRNLSGIIEQPKVHMLREGGPLSRPMCPLNSPKIPKDTRVTQKTQTQCIHNYNSRNFNIAQKTDTLFLIFLE